MRYSVFLCLFFCSCSYNEIVPICEPDIQTFTQLVKPIIESKCIDCHTESSGNPALLTTYDDVLDAIDNHFLRDQVVSQMMPPYGSVPLSESEINIITSWVDCE